MTMKSQINCHERYTEIICLENVLLTCGFIVLLTGISLWVCSGLCTWPVRFRGYGCIPQCSSGTDVSNTEPITVGVNRFQWLRIGCVCKKKKPQNNQKYYYTLKSQYMRQETWEIWEH